MSDEDAPQKNEKHEFLYQYARAAFEDELQRFQNIENKTAKYLNFLSVVIVAYSLLLRYFAAAYFPPEGWLQWLACIAITFTFLALIRAWGFLFSALKFTEMPRLPFDEKFINDFEPQSLPTIHFALTRTCSTALEYAIEGNAKKTRLLTKGHKYTGVAMWALAISVILIVASSLIKNREHPMANDDQKTPPAQQKSSGEPDKSVPPPKVRFAMDSQPLKIHDKKTSTGKSKDE